MATTSVSRRYAGKLYTVWADNSNCDGTNANGTLSAFDLYIEPTHAHGGQSDANTNGYSDGDGNRHADRNCNGHANCDTNGSTASYSYSPAPSDPTASSITGNSRPRKFKNNRTN